MIATSEKALTISDTEIKMAWLGLAWLGLALEVYPFLKPNIS